MNDHRAADDQHQQPGGHQHEKVCRAKVREQNAPVTSQRLRNGPHQIPLITRQPISDEAGAHTGVQDQQKYIEQAEPDEHDPSELLEPSQHGISVRRRRLRPAPIRGRTESHPKLERYTRYSPGGSLRQPSNCRAQFSSARLTFGCDPVNIIAGVAWPDL